MYSLSKKINIGTQADVLKTVFRNEEADPHAAVTYTCNHCRQRNTLEITPYESGFPVLQLYDERKVISGEELLKTGAIAKTSDSRQHFGALTVNDLPTLYFGTSCRFCQSKYLCLFSYGEKQPGLNILTVSGIWQYEETD